MDREPAVQQVLRARDEGRRRRERRGGHDPRALAARRQVGRYSHRLLRAAWRRATSGRGSSTTARAARTSTTTRTRGSSGRRRRSTRTRTRSSSSTTSSAGWCATLEETGQLDDTLVFVTSDNGPEMETWPDAAYSPFRSSKGSTWEGGQRVPGHRLVAGDDRRRPRVRRPVLAAWTGSRRCCGSPAPTDAMPDDRYIDGVDQTSFLLGDDADVEPQVPLLLARHRRSRRVRVRRVEVHARVDLGRRPRRHELGGFSGVTQKYTYGAALQPVPGPEGARSYMIRKLAYLETFQRGIVNHIRTFAEVPAEAASSAVSDDRTSRDRRARLRDRATPLWYRRLAPVARRRVPAWSSSPRHGAARPDEHGRHLVPHRALAARGRLCSSARSSTRIYTDDDRTWLRLLGTIAIGVIVDAVAARDVHRPAVVLASSPSSRSSSSASSRSAGDWSGSRSPRWRRTAPAR